MSAVLARRAYVNENPDLTLRYLKAWIEGIYLFKYRRETALPILKKFTRISEPELLEATYAQIRENLFDAGGAVARSDKIDAGLCGARCAPSTRTLRWKALSSPVSFRNWRRRDL